MEAKVHILRQPEVTDLAGEKVMIDFEAGKYYILKGTANDIWDLLQEGIAVSAIAEALRSDYEVDEETCLNAVTEFLGTMEEKGFIRLQ